jgi:signal transduction histidine kinase
MMALAVPPDLGSRPPKKAPVTPLQRDLLVLFEVGGQILWMNRAAREALGPIANVVEALESGRRLPALECLPLGAHRLWLGVIPDEKGLGLLERLRRNNRFLRDVYCRRGTRNLDLSRAEGRLDVHQRRATRERLQRQAGIEFLQAIESERGRIARDLHDNAGQSMAGILLNLELAERQLGPSHTEVLARLQRSRELASATLDQIRRISHELHPPEWEDQDFAQAVEWLVENMGLRSKLDVDAQIDLPRDVPPAILTVLYRTLQEAFTNTLRHADARRLSIEASASWRGVRLIVEDDGRGSDPSAMASAGHGIGLANIRRRIVSVGGRLDIHSAPGAGMRLTVFVPLRTLPQG